MDIFTMAKYPYLSETVQYIRENAPTLNDLNTSRIYQSVRTQGKERVLEAIKSSNIPDRPFVTDSEALQEILSYIVARIIVSSVKDFFLIRRYSLAESNLMAARLQKEPVDFKLMLSSELDITAQSEEKNPSHIKIHVSDFLRHSTSFHADEWKLVNQDLKDGYVKLEPDRFTRLLKHALQIKFEGELPLPINNEILKNYKADINEIKSLIGSMKGKYKVKEFGRLRLEFLPPCMKHILARTQAGENLPHSARFSITAFLHTVGLGSEEILKIFGTSPDFDASIARYQIDHITGAQSGTEYTPPGCAKLKSYGLCYEPDRLCRFEWMTHPLSYYRVKSKKDDGTGKSRGGRRKREKPKK